MTGIAIGIDIGTSGVRAVLVDEARTTLGFGAAPLDPAARRDPNAWWRATEAALDALRASADMSGVRAIAVDGTSGTVLALDRNGAALGEASLYNDPADPAAVEAVERVSPEDTAARGATSPLAKLLGLQRRAGIVRMLHQADWINCRLCGRFDTTDANNALKTGFDPRINEWPKWMRATGARVEMLPDVVAPGTAIHAITADTANRFGIPEQAVVAAGTTDGCASFLATGASETGDAVTSLGSTLTVKLLADGPIFAPRYGVYSHLVLGRWLAGGASNSGGAALAKYFDAATLETLSAKIDPSRDSGLDYYPLPGPGERFPIADPKLEPREAPRPDDDATFLHGLLEGIATVELRGYQRLAELGAPGLRSVRSVGGGARNAVWSAIRARRLGVPMPDALSDEAAVGAARLALASLGL